jgi:hypothetical protein
MLRVHSTRLFAYVYATVDQPTVSRTPPPRAQGPRQDAHFCGEQALCALYRGQRTDGWSRRRRYRYILILTMGSDR